MQFKIQNWLKRWADAHNCIVKDWQQVSATRMDIWFIPNSEFNLFGEFCPRKSVNVQMFS